VRVEDVSKVIQNKAGTTVILEGISFVVPRTSLFCVTGPSGSGKVVATLASALPVWGATRVRIAQTLRYE
jgi:ABC-type lipoprotein export system ATPase subunit